MHQNPSTVSQQCSGLVHLPQRGQNGVRVEGNMAMVARVYIQQLAASTSLSFVWCLEVNFVCEAGTITSCHLSNAGYNCGTIEARLRWPRQRRPGSQEARQTRKRPGTNTFEGSIQQGGDSQQGGNAGTVQDCNSASA